MCSAEIFVLVLFTDDVYAICTPADVSGFKTKCPAVKYKDGKKYTARILALHEDRKVLEEIQRCLEEDEKSVFIKNIEIGDDKLIFSNVVKKHKKFRDKSKLYLNLALLPSRDENSEGYVFALSNRDAKNFFQIQTDFVEGKIHVEKLRRNSDVKSSNDCETVVPTSSTTGILTDVSIIHSLTDPLPSDILIAPSPTSTILNEIVTIEHEKEARIEYASNETILSVKNLSDSDGKDKCDEKEVIARTGPAPLPDEILIARGPTNNLLNENMTIEHKKEATIEHDSDETIPNVKTLSETDGKDQIVDEKEVTARNGSTPLLDEILIARSPTNNILNENITIDHKKEARIENDSDESILNVKTLSETDGKDQIVDEKEVIARNSSAPLLDEILIAHSPISNIPNENMTIEHKKEARIEYDSNETIHNVKNLSGSDDKDQIGDEKEVIPRNVSKSQSPNKMNTTKREVEMLDANGDHKQMTDEETADARITEKCVRKNQILKTNDVEEFLPRSLFPADRESHPMMVQPLNEIVEPMTKQCVEENRVLEYAHIDGNCNTSVVNNLNEDVHQMSVDESVDENEKGRNQLNDNFVFKNAHNENVRRDENCNFSVSSNRNEDSDMAVDQSVAEEQVQREFQIILREIGMTTSISENVCTELNGNSIYDNIFAPNRQEQLDVEESVQDGAISVPVCDVALNLEAILDPSVFEANSCVDALTSEPRLKPTIVANVILNEKITFPSKKLISSLPYDMLMIPTPASSSTILECSATNLDFLGADNDEERQSIVASVDGKGAVCDEETPMESDDDEYVPSAAESSDSAAESADSDTEEKAEQSIRRKKCQNVSNSSVNITLGPNKEGTSAPDDTELVVQSSKSATHTKKNFCVYCKTLQSKLARHLTLVHAGEEDVKKFATLPAKNLERMQLIATIRKNGNHLYNTDRKFNKGELLVVRRPQERMKKYATDFIACGNCRGQYSRQTVREHFNKCTKKSGQTERLVMVKGRKVSARIHENANDLVRTYVFPYMREDEVVRGVRYDKLVVEFANKQCEKYGLHQHHYQMVRGRVRLLGRFVQAMKNIDKEIKELSDVFQPRHYKNSVRAVRIVAEFNETTRLYAHPAVATNLCTLLKNAGTILRSEYIMAERKDDQMRVEDFLKLQIEGYATSINRGVRETQLQNNRRKKTVLPTHDDISKLYNFLNTERKTYLEKLNEAFSDDTWRKLAEVTLISLQLFNRRRAGEIERVYIEDFNSYQSIDEVADRETYATLSKHGQALARKYVRFMIRGKLGRGVPVLIAANILDCLILILKYRGKAGVPENNPYLFGLPSKDRDRLKYLRACALLRRFADQCGADVAHTLRGTQLRKHVATKCISLNLSENEVSELANFLGHADNIHKQIYRQPDVQNDIVKISQLLEIAQGTNDSLPSDDDSSSEEESTLRSAGPVDVEESPCSEAEGIIDSDTDDIPNRSRKGTKTAAANNSQKSIPATRSGHSHRRWTDLERKTVLDAFKKMIQNGKMPTGDQIQKLINANACLKGREVAQLRTWLHTQKKNML